MHTLALAGLLPALWAGAVGTPESMTEAEFLSALNQSHPEIIASREALASAQARLVHASTFQNPVLDISREAPGEEEQLEWSVSWQLPDRRRSFDVSARRRAVDAELERRSEHLLGLRSAMKEAFAHWALATARHDRLSLQAERVRALAEREHRRLQQGESSGLKARRLDLALGRLQSRLALAAAATEQAEAQVRAWHPGLAEDIRPVMPELPAVPEEIGAHPAVRAAELELAAAELEAEAAKRFVSSPELSVGVQRQDLGTHTVDGPLLGFSWSIPLFDRNQGEKAEAEARISGASARLEHLRRNTRSFRDGALAAFRRLERALKQAQADLEAGTGMLDGAEAAFKHGEAGLTDLLEVHRAVTESHLSVLDLHEAALAAYRELEYAMGHPTAPISEPQEALP